MIGTVLPNGYGQITPRGGTAVYDDEHFSLWERGRGSTNSSLSDGTKVTIYFRKPPLRDEGMLPRGGIARFYGVAKLYKSGPGYEEIWNRLIEPEKKSDAEKKGFGVLIKVVPTAILKRLTGTGESDDSSLDDGSFQFALVWLDRTVPVAGCIGSRDPGASASAQPSAA